MNEKTPARKVGGSFYFTLVIGYGSMAGLLIWNTRDFPQCRVPALLFIGFCALLCWIAEVHLLPGLQAKTLPRKNLALLDVGHPDVWCLFCLDAVVRDGLGKLRCTTLAQT
jgi:hypothetical protein